MATTDASEPCQQTAPIVASATKIGESTSTAEFIPLKQWFVEESERRQSNVEATSSLFYKNPENRAQVRRSGMTLVIPRHHRIPSTSEPDEVLLKEWVGMEAEAIGIGVRALWNRLYRGRHPWPDRMRRVNKRVVFVVIRGAA